MWSACVPFKGSKRWFERIALRREPCRHPIRVEVGRLASVAERQEASGRDLGARIRFALAGVLAEVERARIVDRTLAGLRRARAQGKRLGRPAAITDPLRLRRLLATGASYRAAARALGVSEGTVRRAVRH